MTCLAILEHLEASGFPMSLATLAHWLQSLKLTTICMRPFSTCKEASVFP
ncbi:hypothetical protein CROQUDRAFT_100243 [Cronartium quercuum f. sp. fusiforme G11]|uniref:Uncharacterized protein n=1 Tax=Cronartium quercuum f. sp. fusiforme G11 TaxID=708437 RepID=A0A9P6N7D5_9BASI|nr:hypothetical protein CROQUDRAFT_100243 [Cronartium quercuum f. sp. fusiforme G11]